MRHLALCNLVYLWLFGFCMSENRDEINPLLVHSNVEREVDLTSQLVKITTSYTLENTGKQDIKSFLIAFEPSTSKQLSFIGASVKSLGEEGENLNVVPTSVPNQVTINFYRVTLPKKLSPEKTTTVDVETVFTHSQQPFPTHIGQAEKQLILYTGNVYVFSPYLSKEQKTVVKAATNNIESYSKVPKPVSVSESEVTYGSYENVEPFKQEEMRVHFESNVPFLAISHIERNIEVSHWGNIAVEEEIDLRHTGAILKGTFSRYEYQRDKTGGNSVWAYKTLLPAAASDVYYRDEIGNISTSHLREMHDSVEVELRPRFPLFGGWKTRYLLGYNLPSYEYLFNEGDNYLLKIRFIDHVFDDQQIDDATIRIVLPEGASNIEISSGFRIDRLPDEKHYTYLDYWGRPVIVLHKSNLVEQHIQDFEVKYTFNKLNLLREPAMVIISFWVLFMVVIIWVRLDFSISKDSASESRMRVSALVEQLRKVQDQRSAVYQAYDDAINKYKSSKDVGAFTSNRKRVDGDYKLFSQTISDIQQKLKPDAPDIAEKVAELQKLDRSIKEQIALAITYAEKVVANKMNRVQYVEVEKATIEKREELIEKIEAILDSI